MHTHQAPSNPFKPIPYAFKQAFQLINTISPVRNSHTISILSVSIPSPPRNSLDLLIPLQQHREIPIAAKAAAHTSDDHLARLLITTPHRLIGPLIEPERNQRAFLPRRLCPIGAPFVRVGVETGAEGCEDLAGFLEAEFVWEVVGVLWLVGIVWCGGWEWHVWDVSLGSYAKGEKIGS